MTLTKRQRDALKAGLVALKRNNKEYYDNLFRAKIQAAANGKTKADLMNDRWYRAQEAAYADTAAYMQTIEEMLRGVQGELPIEPQQALVVLYPHGSGARLIDGKIVEADNQPDDELPLDYHGEGTA